MSALTFPTTLPGYIAESWSSEYRTSVFQAISGKEVRTSWASNPRRRFRVVFDCLRDNVNCPSPNASYTEVGLVQNFLSTCKGSWDSFAVTDPVSTSSVTVRLVEDSIRLVRVASHVWACDFEVVEVL